jgi:hypothetical protein
MMMKEMMNKENMMIIMTMMKETGLWKFHVLGAQLWSSIPLTFSNVYD